MPQDQLISKVQQLMEMIPEEARMVVIKKYSGGGSEGISPRVSKLLTIYNQLTPEEKTEFKNHSGGDTALPDNEMC